jgi:hypothetical protein
MPPRVGEHREKEVRAHPVGLRVKDRAPFELRFQAAEHGFEIGEPDVGVPKPALVPRGEGGAQAIDSEGRVVGAGLALPRGRTFLAGPGLLDQPRGERGERL